MPNPELTANLSCTVSCCPREDLSVSRNVTVSVYRDGDSYYPAYTDATGQVVPSEPAASRPHSTPEAAMRAGVWNLLVDISETIQEHISGDLDNE